MNKYIPQEVRNLKVNNQKIIRQVIKSIEQEESVRLVHSKKHSIFNRIIIPALTVGLTGFIILFITFTVNNAGFQNESSIRLKEAFSASQNAEEMNITEGDRSETSIMLLDREIQKFDNLVRQGEIKVRNNEVNSYFIDTTTNEKFFIAQATNELGNASEYQKGILTEWYAALDVTVTSIEINGELAVIKSSDTGVDSVHVVTNQFVYTFGGDSYETLLKYAKEIEYK